MNPVVRQLYERGDTRRLIGIAQGAGTFGDDCAGACQALRLLARLGDHDAIAFCAAAADAGSPAARAH